MKLIRPVFFTLLSTLSIFAAVVYTACNKDKCKDVICLNLGACDGGVCKCPVGYEGDRCQTKSRDKFIKTFNGWDTCSSRTFHPYKLKFTAVIGNPLQLMLKNVFDDPFDSAICTIQSVDSFVFQGANNAASFFGYGKMRNDTLRVKYHYERDTNYADCVYEGYGLK